MATTGPTRRQMLGGAASAAATAAAGGAARAQDAPDAAGAALTPADAASAERVAGLAYSDAERAQMMATLEARLDVLVRLRGVEKPNSLAPALTFDPRLPGAGYPDQDDSVILHPAEVRPLPSDPADIAFASTADHARWLEAGAITSRELTELYLDRIARYAPGLECFVTVTPGIARAQADQADAERAAGQRRGALHGVPYALKDLFDAEGTPATWGAEPYRDRMSEGDSAVAARLKAAGAVLLGKTTLGAIAYGDIWFGGITRNPWNPAEGSSGSSAGSASATAAGLVSFAIGTETLGSLISPSERCGTATLRPTFGRISRAGAMALCWSLDKVGPLARSAEDCALVMAALNGYDPADAGSLSAGFAYDGSASVEDMRVGFDPAWYEDADPLDLAAWEALKGLGITPVEIALPDLPYDALVEQLMAEAAAAFEELTFSGRDDDMVWQEEDAWPNGWRAARLISAVDLIQIDRLRRRVMQEMHAVFEGLDAMAGPNFAGPMLRITNFTGHPQAAIRAGFRQTPTRAISGRTETDTTRMARTPHNFSVWGPVLGDGNALRLAAALERELDVWAEQPPGFG